MSLNIAELRNRAALMRSTAKADGECRVLVDEEVVLGGRTTSVLELGYKVAEGHWPVEADALVPLCGTDGCVMHLGYESEHVRTHQLVADTVPRRSLADVFRAGRMRGLFKGIGSYAE
jgi:hypothetical protein